MTVGKSLQERNVSESIYFGCGPANVRRLRIRSSIEGDTYVCKWRASRHHEVFAGVLNGGIIWIAAGLRLPLGSGPLPYVREREW